MTFYKNLTNILCYHNCWKEKAVKKKSTLWKKYILSAAVIGLGAMGSGVAVAQSFSPEQKAEIEKMFKDYIMNNPEVLMQSVSAYQQKEEDKSRATAEQNLKGYMDYFLNGNTLPMTGNPQGDVTLVEFFDYNCGYCKKAYSDILQILQQDQNIRVVFQEMPILSPSSSTMSKIALAANNQGKYWDVHKALMDYRGGQNEANILEMLAAKTELGLDMNKLKEDMASALIDSTINKNMKVAKDLGIRGTPGFIVGEQIYPGYIGIDGLKTAIADARKNKSGAPAAQQTPTAPPQEPAKQ